MGWEVPTNQQVLEYELGESKHPVRVSTGDPKSYLHDQRDRVIEQRDSQSHQKAQAVSNRWFREEGGLSCDPGGLKKVDNAH